MIILLFVFIFLAIPTATASGVSMFKVNFGTDDPSYYETIADGNFESCFTDSSTISCSVYEQQTRVILNPKLRGVLNYDEAYIKFYDIDGNIKRVPAELFVIDLMGWIGVPNFHVPGLPYIMFEKDTKSEDIIGVRLWWIFLIGLLFAKGLK